MRDKLITAGILLGIVALIWALNKYLMKSDEPPPPPVLDFTIEPKEQPKENRMLTATVETNKGTFSFELFPEDAPGTVENFKKLADEGFYDGTIFHRVVAGFVMQGGDPEGTGMGGPGYTIKAEFNDRKHVAGTVAMARSAHPDSAGSQFYVCLAPAPHLNNQYTVFGQVTEGLDVVLEIGNVATDRNSRPLEEIKMSKVTVHEETAAAE